MTDKFIPSTQLIEKLPDICVNLELISVYDMNCYSTAELIYKLAQKINDIIVNGNHNDEAFKAQLDDLQIKLEYLLGEGLTAELQKIIEKMYADGTLQALVGEAIVDINKRLDKLETDVTSINSQLDNIQNSNPINPEWFVGTDLEKLQKALDYSIENDYRPIHIGKMYDITGGTIFYKKERLGDRRLMRIIGTGGGIIKNDKGYIFDGVRTDTSDLHVSNLEIESLPGKGTVMYNCTNLIGIMSVGNTYREVDTIIETLTRWTQTVRLINEHIHGGRGFKVNCLQTIDTSIVDCVIEDCEGFFSNISKGTSAINTNLRIQNNVIENLSGITMQMGAVYGCNIESNYFELNKEYLDFETLNGFYHFGLNVKNNTFTVSQDDITNGKPCIKWGAIGHNLAYGYGGAISTSNFSNGTLHELKLSDNGYVTSSGDYGKITNPKNLIAISKPFINSNTDNSVTINYGFCTQMTNSITATVPSGGFQLVEIPFEKGLLNTDVVSISFSNAYGLQIYSTQIKTNSVAVLLKNVEASDMSRIVYCNIMRLGIVNS